MRHGAGFDVEAEWLRGEGTSPTAATESDRLLGVTTERSTEAQSNRWLASMARWVSALLGTLLGLLPHLLHHTGLIFGAVLVTGAGGNLLFGVLGLLFSLPLLRRLYVRFGSWRAPAAALVLLAAMFALSAFVIGPAISGDPTSETPLPTQPSNHSEHEGHTP